MASSPLPGKASDLLPTRRNSRKIMESHVQTGKYRSCPVCQFQIEQDHKDALLLDQALQDGWIGRESLA